MGRVEGEVKSLYKKVIVNKEISKIIRVWVREDKEQSFFNLMLGYQYFRFLRRLGFKENLNLLFKFFQRNLLSF